MRTIPLTQGCVALVDDEDFEHLSKRNWYAKKDRHTFYAATAVKVRRGRGGQRMLTMHRAILGFSIGDGRQTDHKDGNGLNNQKENLRECTQTQNIRNQGIRSFPGKLSRFRGVTFYVAKDKRHRGRKHWIAQIATGGRMRRIGRFLTELEAAIAYNEAARVKFGEFARLNNLAT